MTKTSMFAALFVVGAAGAADAGGQVGSLGVGAEYLLSGAGGASLNYDGGDWHAGGFLGFFDPGVDNADSLFQLGGRFYYHVHSTAMSDFGVGGALGVISVPNQGPMDDERETDIYVEPGIQIRIFLASNVALSASTGIILGVSDADGVAITGGTIGGSTVTDTGGGRISLGGGIGIHYYFF